uniref:Uncharacterized protein n=1 Tax=Arundo donax TaxID=35708 RepID=A0A0A8YN34_ARUDO
MAAEELNGVDEARVEGARPPHPRHAHAVPRCREPHRHVPGRGQAAQVVVVAAAVSVAAVAARVGGEHAMEVEPTGARHHPVVRGRREEHHYWVRRRRGAQGRRRLRRRGGGRGLRGMPWIRNGGGDGGHSESSVDAMDPFSRRHGSPPPPPVAPPPAPSPGAICSRDGSSVTCTTKRGSSWPS